MKHYELLVVVKPTLSPEEASAKVESLKELLQKNDSTITKVDEMGVRKLAYEIDKHQRGNYTVFYYQTNPSSIDEILRNLRLDEDILRFLNIKYEKKKEIAQWEQMVKGKKAEPKKSAPKAKEEEAAKEESKEQES